MDYTQREIERYPLPPPVLDREALDALIMDMLRPKGYHEWENAPDTSGRLPDPGEIEAIIRNIQPTQPDVDYPPRTEQET